MKIHKCIRKLVWLFTIIWMGIGAAVGEQLPKDMQRITENGKLTVALYFEDLHPFFVQGDDGLHGLDIDVAQMMADKLGVELEFVRKAETFDELVHMVARRDADVVISVLSRTVDRARYVRFSEPYLQLRQALMINRLMAVRAKLGKDVIAEMNREDIRIGVVRGSSYVGFANDLFPKANIVQFDRWDEIVAAVLNEELFAAFYDSVEVKNFLKDNKTANLYIQTMILQDNVDDISVAVHSDDTHLLSWVNLFIHSLRQRGRLRRLEAEYL